MGSTMEKLFLQIFERKLLIYEQARQQNSLFDQRLASKCLLDGITPPPWLLSPSLSSLPNELNKEELISGLLLPPGNHYPSSSYPLQPAVTVNKGGKPNGSCKELHVVGQSFDAGDRLSVLPQFPASGDAQCNLNGVPELDVSVTSPQDCRDAKASENLPDHSQSLARIQRSKSRQKALELRNSVKAGKTCPNAENNVATCNNRLSVSGVKSLEFHHADQSEFVKFVDTSNGSSVAEEARLDKCMAIEKSSDTCRSRSRSNRQKASYANEPGYLCDSTYDAKGDDLSESISMQQPNQVDDLTELVSVVGHANSGAPKEYKDNHKGNEEGTTMYSGGIPRCASSIPQTHSTKQHLDVDHSYIDKEDCKIGESIGGSSQQPDCVYEMSELARPSSFSFNGKVKAKVHDSWSKPKVIHSWRSSIQQADCENESLNLDGYCGEDEEEKHPNPADDLGELVKPFNFIAESCGGQQKMSNCLNNEEGNDSNYGKITRSRSSNLHVTIVGLSKENSSSNMAINNDGSLLQSSGRSSQPPEQLKLVREEAVSLMEVLGTHANMLPCIETKTMVDLGISDAVVAETNVDYDARVEACSVTSRSNSDGSSLGMQGSDSRPVTDCAMLVKPNQLDSDDVNDCCLNEISDLALENKQQHPSSEKRVPILSNSRGILDNISVNYQKKPISSIKMPLLENREFSSNEEEPLNDSPEALVTDAAVLVDEIANNSVQERIATYQNENGDCCFMDSWPQHKRRKMAGQLISSVYASPSLMRKLFQPNCTDHVNGNINAVGDNPDIVQISECFDISDTRDAVPTDVIKSSIEEIHQNPEPLIAGPGFSSPKLQVEEAEYGLEGRSRSANKLGARSPPSLTALSTGDSQGCLLEEVPVANPPSVIFDGTGQYTAEKSQASMHLEDRFELGSTELLTHTQITMQERKSYPRGNENSRFFSGGSPPSQPMDLIGADPNMPVYEWFGMETKEIDLELDLSDNALESAMAMEQLCKSVCLQTPLSHFSTAYKSHKTLNLYQSVPNGVLEGIEMRNTVNSNGITGKQHEANSNCFNDEINCTSGERLLPDFPAFSTASSTWDIKKPCMSPVGSVWEGITPKSGSSEKKASSIPDLPCISEENENTIEVPETFQNGIDSEVVTSSVKREPLVDVTKSFNPAISAYESEILSDRCSLASVNMEFSFSGTCRKSKSKHGNWKGSRRKYTSKAKENQRTSVGVPGVKRTNEPPHNGHSKPMLSRKASLRKGGPSLIETESKCKNIVSNIASFIPLVQQKQAAVVTGKRDAVKVKALEAAEFAKRLAEKKENERKMRKEALKVERAKMEEQNLRQLELEKERKEQERKRKEADLLARKRKREEEEKKERERKKKRAELARRQQHLMQEEKLCAEKEERENNCRAADVKTFDRKESKDVSGKHDKMEKEKGDNKLRKVPETGPVTTMGATTDDVKSSIVPENCDRVDNLKEMSVCSEETEKGNLISNVNQEQSYEISPYKGSDDEDEDDEDEDEDDDMENSKFIPSWASKDHLILMVHSQQRIHPQSIFPPESFRDISEVLWPRKLQQK